MSSSDLITLHTWNLKKKSNAEIQAYIIINKWLKEDGQRAQRRPTRGLALMGVILNHAKQHESQAAQQNNAAALTAFTRLTMAAFMTPRLMTARPGTAGQWEDRKRDSNPQLLCANTWASKFNNNTWNYNNAGSVSVCWLRSEEMMKMWYYSPHSPGLTSDTR